ncbi:MAG TPA: hypothetical protein VMJ66_14665 [Geobacteraceae bacterium]|nr:hypothetical protein [Geobacteraceae bacterium]
MAGRIRQLIDETISQQAGENDIMAQIIRTKLLLKGIDSEKYTVESEDDPTIIAKLEIITR